MTAHSQITGTALLTEEEAAKRLLLSARTLRDLRRTGLIRYVRLSARKIGYRPEDCDDYVASRVCVEQPMPLSPPATRRKSAKRAAFGNVVPFSQRGKAR